MPAEWSPHRATWLSWPNNRETWPDHLERVRDVWAAMIRALSPREHVYLLVNDEEVRGQAAARLEAAGAAMSNVSLPIISTVDVWMRDYGPTFVTRERKEAPLAFNDWIFNGWGGKYPAYELDDRVAEEIALMLNVPVFRQAVVLEGGSIEVNGNGSCMTSEQCLLNPNRNPQLARPDIERLLQDSLGVSQIIWLEDGIAGDDTDGHIDDIARFVAPTTIVCALEENPRDENYRPLQRNYERLLAARDPRGEKFMIVPLPCPAPVVYAGTRLPASYANFYIANGAVLVPVFGDAKDETALGILRELFPRHEVLGFPCNEVVSGLGAIHCVTQQEPAILGSRA
jgi:agmatine deiminase